MGRASLKLKFQVTFGGLAKLVRFKDPGHHSLPGDHQNAALSNADTSLFTLSNPRTSFSEMSQKTSVEGASDYSPSNSRESIDANQNGLDYDNPRRISDITLESQVTAKRPNHCDSMPERSQIDLGKAERVSVWYSISRVWDRFFFALHLLVTAVCIVVVVLAYKTNIEI